MTQNNDAIYIKKEGHSPIKYLIRGGLKNKTAQYAIPPESTNINNLIERYEQDNPEGIDVEKLKKYFEDPFQFTDFKKHTKADDTVYRSQAGIKRNKYYANLNKNPSLRHVGKGIKTWSFKKFVR